MPANKYTRSLYKTGTVASEKAAIANRDPARKKAAEKIMKREGTTSPSRRDAQRLRCQLKRQHLKCRNLYKSFARPKCTSQRRRAKKR
jgi:hypothetical protein